MTMIKDIGQHLIDTLSSIAFEVSRRVCDEITARGLPIPNGDALEREIGRVVRAKTISTLVDYFVGNFKALPYAIAPDGRSITCMRCGSTSYNPNDIANCYCGQCKRFMRDTANR